MVAGEAAAAVSSEGRFVTTVMDPTGVPELTSAQALALAPVWAHDFASNLQPQLERERGGPIDFNGLEVCGAPLYGNTAYLPLPSTAPRELRNLYGASWFVTLCDPVGPAIDLSVSAAAVENHVENGHVAFPPVSGMDFYAHGIPLGSALPISPERAVQVAYEATGRRVTSVPELVKPGGHVVPQYARWRLVLESPVAFHPVVGAPGAATPVSVTTDEVFIGYAGPGSSERLFVRAPAPPRPMEETYVTPQGAGHPTGLARGKVTLAPRPTMALDYLTVTTGGN